MSYVIQAVVADRELAVALAAALPPAVAVPLAQGKALVPFTKAFRSAHALPWLPLTDRAPLPDSIATLCARASQGGPIAYVEAELFGGAGTQAAALFVGGVLVEPPVVGGRAIAAALGRLGVRAGSAHDEFDALGLGAHRDVEEWIA